MPIRRGHESVTVEGKKSNSGMLLSTYYLPGTATSTNHLIQSPPNKPLVEHYYYPHLQMK